MSEGTRIKAKPNQLMDAEHAIYEVSGEDLAFVYLEGTGTRFLAFYIERNDNFILEVERLAKNAPLPAREMKFRVVGTSGFVQRVAKRLTKLGFLQEKCVERNGRIELRFDVLKRKILLAKLVETSGKELHASHVGPAKVLIVDDSSTIRTLLKKIFASDTNIKVVGETGNPFEIEDLLTKHQPDVVTLDIHMPGMNGVEALKKYLPKFPVPTIMISSVSKEEGPLVFDALEAGAVDYIQKPSLEELATVGPKIIEHVHTARKIRVGKGRSFAVRRVDVREGELDMQKIIAIGASTGGTEALREVLVRFPEKIPPVLIVQHIPAVFSKHFAERLNSLCPFEVKEAEDGDEIRPGRVLIAPGGKQMRVSVRGGVEKVVVEDGPPVNRHKPSVDVLFDSIAQQYGSRVIGAILTGMGADGANGLLNIKKAGAQTFGQDEATSVVYGMPKAAFERGAVGEVASLLEIPQKLIIAAKRRVAA